MKRFLILGLLLLNGCVLTNPPTVLQYDSNEYMVISDIKISAMNTKQSCGDYKVVSSIVDMKNKIQRAKVLVEYPEQNIEILNSIIEIEKMSDEMYIRYNTTIPTETYCKLKMDNIITSIDIIRKHLASRRTSNGINY